MAFIDSGGTFRCSQSGGTVGGDAGFDTETHVVQLTQLINYGIDFPPVGSPGIEDENEFSIAKDDKYLLGG